MEKELIPINIVIADRTYRLKIAPADEENLRKTMKLINEKIVEFKTNFSGKDMQDFVAMVLLWFATEIQKPKNEQAESLRSNEELNKLEELLDKALRM